MIVNDLTFEQTVEEIRILDVLRNRIIDKITEGKKSLEGFDSKVEWDKDGDAVEKGLLIKIFHDKREKILPVFDLLKPKLSFKKLFEENISFTTGDDDRVPVLRASVCLNSFILVPDFVISEEALNCYYRIIFEFQKPSDIEKVIGGASSGDIKVPRTAFMTRNCIKAVFNLSEAFRNSAIFLKSISKSEPNVNFPLTKWFEVDKKRVKLSSEITFRSFDNILFNNDENIYGRIQEIKNNLSNTLNKIPKKYNTVKPKLQQIKDKLELVDSNSSLKDIAEKLNDIATLILKDLEPTAKYLLNVVEHELADDSIHPNKRICDAAELIFASEGLKILNKWDDTSNKAMFTKVLPLITYKGRIPSHKPFDIAKKGYVLHVAGAEVIDAISGLINMTKFPIDEDTIQKFINFFDETWKEDGWRHERSEANDDSAKWVTAISLNALSSLHKTVNHSINQRIFKHLSVKQPKEINLELENLFYPDYGLHSYSENSLCIHLQELRCHVLGVNEKEINKVSEVKISKLYSTILFGPPGTGKTTIVEALAKSSHVPLVEITPSDILMGGEEKVENRARVVFEALSMLTDCVILFDEFEPILWRREEGGKPNTIYQFLTPGMLPKLKKLHEKFKNQRVAYVLSTNLIGGLDEAAIRGGRFDSKIGVYPPDLYSRTGRLLYQILVNKKSDENIDIERFNRVILATSGRSMEKLGKWFTYNKDEHEKNLINYILKRSDDLPKIPKPEKEFPEIKPNYFKRIFVDKNSENNIENSQRTSFFVEAFGEIDSSYNDKEYEEWKKVHSEDNWFISTVLVAPQTIESINNIEFEEIRVKNEEFYQEIENKY